MRFNVDDYVDVQTRINKFWSENPSGAIVTEVIYGVDFDRVIVRAQVFKSKEPGAKTDTLPDSTGIAAEIRGESPRDGANFTSWHENAETSAIGRALANMGYATSGKDRPSRQEMEKVERSESAPVPSQTRTAPTNAVQGKPTIQNPDAPVSDSQLNYIRGLAKQLGMTVMGPDGDMHTDEAALEIQLSQHYSTSLASMTKGQASEVIEGFKEALKSKATQGQLMPNGADRYTS